MLGERIHTNPWDKGVGLSHHSVAISRSALGQLSGDGLLYVWSKRLLDIVGATILLALSLPLWVIIAILIRLDSPGPVIFVQKRVGQNGRIFDFYKFRSMRSDGDHEAIHREFAKSYISGHDVEQQEGQDTPIFKPANGQGVTKVGWALRRTTMDELPQLINVLRGDLSLVGPRPSMLCELEQYSDWHWRRLEVMQGLTGLAQVNGRSSIPFKEIVRIDLEYVKRRSLWLDLNILLQTPLMLISGKGSG